MRRVEGGGGCITPGWPQPWEVVLPGAANWDFLIPILERSRALGLAHVWEEGSVFEALSKPDFFPPTNSSILISLIYFYIVNTEIFNMFS